MMNTITIGLTGDVMLGRTLDSVIASQGYDYPWGDVLPIMQQTDLNIINLETTLTNSKLKIPKAFNFKCSPDKVASLLRAHIGVTNLANNHILDFSTHGLSETIVTLDEANIKHVGAEKDHPSATKPVVIEKNQVRIGLLGLTDNEPTWQATQTPGTNYVDLADEKEKENVLRSIDSLTSQADIVIVTVHWGPNMQEKPWPVVVDFAHTMIEHGANVVHGHSAHILQGIECYRGNLILYDTGDFVDDYAVDPALRNDLAAFFVLTVHGPELIHLKCIPTRIFAYQVNQARAEDYRWVINRLQKLSAEFDTSVDMDGMVYLAKTDKHIHANPHHYV
jgi:poly-gamma-glutamate capsule biosynthesis protein CapA/YwtB (metallophosphatase superfamily)